MSTSNKLSVVFACSVRKGTSLLSVNVCLIKKIIHVIVPFRGLSTTIDICCNQQTFPPLIGICMNYYLSFLFTLVKLDSVTSLCGFTLTSNSLTLSLLLLHPFPLLSFAPLILPSFHLIPSPSPLPSSLSSLTS